MPIRDGEWASPEAGDCGWLVIRGSVHPRLRLRVNKGKGMVGEGDENHFKNVGC